jgi:uncharacterized protein YbcI
VIESTTPTTEHETLGEMLEEVSQRLVRLHKDGYGRDPIKARSVLADDLLVCILEGGRLETERSAMQEALRERFVAVVEEATDRKVQSFMSANDEHRELTAEIFLLEPRGPDLGSDNEAIQRWAEQTRRQNRKLGGEQAALREKKRGTVEPRRRPDPDDAA